MKMTHSGLKTRPISLSMAILIGIAACFTFKPIWAESPAPGNQGSQITAVQKPEDGKGKLPSFAEVDINSDHVITKNELQNFPYMLQTFNKVDAGEDGKLEQHEYENLKIETKREGQVR